MAWLATVVFLDLSPRATGLSHDRAFDLVMEVSEGLLDVEEIATLLLG